MIVTLGLCCLNQTNIFEIYVDETLVNNCGESMKKAILKLLLFISSVNASEYVDWDELEANLRAAGGNIKALRHMKCFIDKGSDRAFKIRKPTSEDYNNRCYSTPEKSISNQKIITLIDYTANSNKKRMFLIDREDGSVFPIAVAHGRYESGFFKRKLKYNHNTVKRARYYSNDFGSNAPSSGFYLAGHEYSGKWGRSLVLHGLEEDINDNACQRAVVIHAHKLVSKNNAYVMSSGCPMVSKSRINGVINGISSPSLEEGGGLVFVYGKREKEWEDDYCGEI